MKAISGTTALLITALLAFTGCSKEYAEFDNGEVVENTYSGNVEVTSGGADPAGDFEGNGDSGTYSFAWENSQSVASLNFDVTTSSGSVQMTINDADGNQVLNETLPRDGEDSFSGVSNEGRTGMWLVTIQLNDFDGDGSYSLHPGE